MTEPLKLITTIKERCRVCYTCVRHCPAKAIRILGGQAEVISERCIGCGNCIRVCSQNAKQPCSAIDVVRKILDGSGQKAAIVAPSFPASFPEIGDGDFVGVLKKFGFDLVCETAFGADLVADAYRRLLNTPSADGVYPRLEMSGETCGSGYIGTTCPAVVSYIKRYHPDLVKHLAPIVSPMIAAARYLHRIHGDGLKIVFIGPCIAKRSEAVRVGEGRDVDAVLTFLELRSMARDAGISWEKGAVSPATFDPPHPGLGMLFPLTRGMLQAADIHEDLLEGDVVAAEGRDQFVQAIKAFESGVLSTKLLEVLCCNGCIMGPGMSCDTPLFRRRSAVSARARRRLEKADSVIGANAVLDDNDLTVSFEPDDRRMPPPSDDEIEKVMIRLGKCTPEDELDCGACGYETCREHAIAILKGFAESEMCLPFVIEQLKSSLDDLSRSNTQLASTQKALMDAEKLASMGQLSAGIAHEINNPLGVILLYANLLLKEVSSNSEYREDLAMIVEQAERCKTIVSGLLNFARQRKLALKSTHICELVDHNLKAVMLPDNIDLQVSHRVADPFVDVDPQQIIQVLINLVVNAQEAMPNGGTIRVSTDDDEHTLRILVSDTGPGIPEGLKKKIFEPLFTTKQIGKGTGLGLAVTYGIVKMHSGDIHVENRADKSASGATFVVALPKRRGEAPPADFEGEYGKSWK